MEQPHYIIEMNHIYKSFSGVEALKDVSINLKKMRWWVLSGTMEPGSRP